MSEINEISTYNLRNDPDNPKYRYKLIRKESFKAICGQGDVEFEWKFLCVNHKNELVLITENYLVYWGNHPSPDNIEMGQVSITEKKLSKRNPMGSSYREISLPIELHLQGKDLDGAIHK